jgi:predicted acyltransferase
MAEKTANRLTYIDWLRGLACLLMFQTHCYDSWLGGAAREGKFIQWSQLLGTLPAPLFLFLSGISVALVTDKLRQKGVAADEIARKTILRGGQIFLFALLFRLQEFLLGLKYAPWTDLLRVDVLPLAPVVAGVVYQRGAHIRGAAAVVVPGVPLVGIRIRGIGDWFFSAIRLGAAK